MSVFVAGAASLLTPHSFIVLLPFPLLLEFVLFSVPGMYGHEILYLILVVSGVTLSVLLFAPTFAPSVAVALLLFLPEFFHKDWHVPLGEGIDTVSEDPTVVLMHLKSLPRSGVRLAVQSHKKALLAAVSTVKSIFLQHPRPRTGTERTEPRGTRNRTEVAEQPPSETPAGDSQSRQATWEVRRKYVQYIEAVAGVLTILYILAWFTQNVSV